MFGEVTEMQGKMEKIHKLLEDIWLNKSGEVGGREGTSMVKDWGKQVVGNRRMDEGLEFSYESVQLGKWRMSSD